MKPTASCILPVYNGARFLREAIESVLAQVPVPDEFIIIDDGSTDGSGEIARGFAPRVRVITQENAGPSAARNRGLAVATGEFICFQDADDLWAAGKLQRQLSCFRKDPDLFLCYAHALNFWEPELKAFADRVRDHAVGKPRPSHAPPLLLARREAFDIVGPFDESLHRGEDTDWHLRAREAGLKWELLPDVLVHRRRHGGNLTANWGAGDPIMLERLHASITRRR